MPSKEQQPIAPLLKRSETTFSIEFFPPKDDKSWEQFHQTASKLATLEPDFVSITYGAGGSTRARTELAARELKDRYGFLVMPHLTCVGSTEKDIVKLVEGWVEEGYRNIMALRGDPPKGQTTFEATAGGPKYGSELIAILKKHFPEICLGAAGYPEKHPEARNPEDDMDHLQAKVDAGADFITTQLFFDNESFYRYRDAARLRGIDLPINAGIMPVLSYSQIKRFTEMCGASLPASLTSILEPISENKEEVENKGIEWATEQISDLYAHNVDGVHLYALNRARAAVNLAKRLFGREKLSPQPS
ncbi:MAG: methylenetetrahydrofolate reductase [NAD(P)H] [Opitutales bacterium]|nr:methylenetetrahydrofolate reductase [NAD(P)H] [Opitutales bacterium]MCH8539161.1 methylenetetrahydrofolate reductase [NAD(P)H] [Opitutales bacterium]